MQLLKELVPRLTRAAVLVNLAYTVNLNAARALGVRVPKAVLGRADQIID